MLLAPKKRAVENLKAAAIVLVIIPFLPLVAIYLVGAAFGLVDQRMDMDESLWKEIFTDLKNVNDKEKFEDAFESIVDYDLKPEIFQDLKKEFEALVFVDNQRISNEEYSKKVVPLLDGFIKRGQKTEEPF